MFSYWKSITPLPFDKDIKSVGVFLNNTYEEIINICSKNIIDIIQIHGNISDEFITGHQPIHSYFLLALAIDKGAEPLYL